MRTVSLYSGCGGLDYGFHENGYKVIYACDNDQAAVDCFNLNFGNVAVKRDVESQEFLDDLESLNNVDLVLGGFPCQGFSKSGPKKRDDSRNQLYLGMVRAIEKLRPRFFVAENVDGLAQNFNGEMLDSIYSEFKAQGYFVKYKILNAVNYGVAQHRRRVIFTGFRYEEDFKNFEWPCPTHKSVTRNGEFKLDVDFMNTESLPKALTIGNAIEDLLNRETEIADHTWVDVPEKQIKIIKRIGPGQKLCNVRFADTSVYTWNIPEVFGEVTEKEIIILETIGKNRRKKIYGNIPNGNPLSIETVNSLSGYKFKRADFEKLVIQGYLKNKDNKYDLKGAMFCSGLYKRPSWNEPSPTVITVFDNPRYFIHPIENRPFSIRECARLQSFPDTFKFLDSGISKTDAYRLIGNAVPVNLAKSIAESISKILVQKKQHVA